ncbi:uncharacterized protein LOC128235339 [Mya arenaria]|uniref:uncharacterized protein LOC128235339 n=1 Tax=Mya arenaria TaxID=6604 RepID=UPI0022E131B3|nr:uncharacterized protein LOC128235339 [Mya arenaria]
MSSVLHVGLVLTSVILSDEGFSKIAEGAPVEGMIQKRAHYCIQWPALAESPFAHQRDWLIRFAEWLSDGSIIAIFRVNSFNQEKLVIEKTSNNMDNIREILLSIKPVGIGREISAEQLNANLLECFPKANAHRHTPDMAEIFMIIGQTNLDITYGFRNMEIKGYVITFGEAEDKVDWLPFVTDGNHIISASNLTLLHGILVKDSNKICRIYEYFQTSIPQGCRVCTDVCNDRPSIYCIRKAFAEECEYLTDLWQIMVNTTTLPSPISTGTTPNKHHEIDSSRGSDSGLRPSATAGISVGITLIIIAVIVIAVTMLQNRNQNRSFSSIEACEQMESLNQTDKEESLSNNNVGNGTQGRISHNAATRPTSGSNSPTSGSTQPTSGSTQPTSGSTQPTSGSTQPTSGSTQPPSTSTCINVTSDCDLMIDTGGKFINYMQKVAAVDAPERVENVHPDYRRVPAGTQATD